MSEIDLKAAKETKEETGASGSFDREEWAQRKRAEREHAFELIDRMAGLAAVSGDRLKSYLDVQSRFPEYSVGNALLITGQMPSATRLGDFGYWKGLGASIRKGEIGIILLQAGKEFEKSDGSTGIRFDAKRVFDLSQTTLKQEIEPEPEIDFRALLKALLQDAPCRVVTEENENIPDHRAAWYSPGRKTLLVSGKHAAVTVFRQIAEELVHADLDQDGCSKEDHAFTAYCVSYLVCCRYRVDTGDFCFDDLPESFSSLEPREVRNVLSQIRTEANRICRNIEKAFADREMEPAREAER